MKYDVHPKWGVPKEEISCPGCGKVYGYRKRKVCLLCHECAKCCGKHVTVELVSAEEFITKELELVAGDYSS